jgi:hypothetical protein
METTPHDFVAGLLQPLVERYPAELLSTSRVPLPDLNDVNDSPVTALEQANARTKAMLATIEREEVDALAAYCLTTFPLALRIMSEIDRLRSETAESKSNNEKMLRTIGALKRWSNDPIQVAKTEAFKLWTERRAGKHPRLRTNEQFAIECMRRWPALRSAAVITGWCTAWTKAAKGRKTQSAS